MPARATAFLLTLSVAGCARVEPDAHQSTSLSAGGATREPLAARPRGPAGRAVAVRVEQLVTIPSGVPDAARLARLPRLARDAVQSATMPVLAPERAGLLTGATLVARPEWWSLSMQHDGLTVVISSTRLAHRYAGLVDPAQAGADGRIRGNRSVRGTDAWVTRNEAIPSVTWMENGASLSLEVECAHPTDTRCEKDDELLALASSLAWIGGGSS